MFLSKTDDNVFVYSPTGDVIYEDFDHVNIDTYALHSNRVIAVKNVNEVGAAYFIGQLQQGNIVTDSTWRCVGGVEQSGWYAEDFDDSDWPYAVELGTNVYDRIASDAKLIWTDDNADTIYCRKVFQTGKNSK